MSCLLMSSGGRSLRSATTRLAVVLLVPTERARRGELPELVADHRLGDEHRDVLATVVHREGVAQEVRGDDRPAGPGLDDVLGALLVLHVHLLLQVVVDEGALLQTARHLVVFSLSALLAGAPTTHDQLVARLVRTAGAALGLAPGAHRVTATGGLALTTSVRVVHRVHRHTTGLRALALPAHPAGLAPADVGLLGVADLTDAGAAAGVDVADLTGGHPQLGELALPGHQLHRGTGGPGDLRPTTGLELHRVDHGTDRDVAQRQAVAGLDVRTGTVLDPVALLQPHRGEDVTLLAVGIVQQRDRKSTRLNSSHVAISYAVFCL